MTAILITSLILSGCAASKNDNDKKVSHKERDKSKSKKKEAENETCRNNGMKEDAIHEKDKYDRKDFNSALRIWNHSSTEIIMTAIGNH